MLPQDYRFSFENRTGVQLDFNGNSANEKIDLDFKPWKRDSNGALVYASEVNLAYSAADIADTAGAAFTDQDNATNLNDGVFGILTVLTDNASADGAVLLYVEWASDGTGTVFPSDLADFVRSEDAILLGALNIVGDGAGYTRAIIFAFSLPG